MQLAAGWRYHAGASKLSLAYMVITLVSTRVHHDSDSLTLGKRLLSYGDNCIFPYILMKDAVERHTRN